MKFRIFVILILVYLISFLSLRFNFNLFYPYYLVKDLFFFPVQAIEEDIKLDKKVVEGINEELKLEIEELKQLNELSNTLTDFSFVSASVIERNRMYWFNTITINKGSDSGIKEDMAVISSKGLIGKINKVSKSTSEIKLITTNDINSKISVMIKNKEDILYGILSGYDASRNYLEVTSVNKNLEIENGSLVYTSGMGGIFPSGILIGSVSGNIKDKYDVSKIIEVKPNTDFNSIKFVRVLIRE